jgi:hypothetical protein
MMLNYVFGTGTAIVTLDKFTSKPSLTHPFLMVFLVVVLAAIGWMIGKVYRLNIRNECYVQLFNILQLQILFKDSSKRFN